MDAPPLVIDLDGTLLRSDLLIESGLAFVRAHPAHAIAPLAWLLYGKASLKARLANETRLDVSHLPYDQRVLKLIAEERAKGRQIVLATASHKTYAEKIAAHLAVFDRVLATDEDINLSAQAKRDCLVAEYGDRGFDYAGNSRADLPVWRAARQAYVVNSAATVERSARALGNVVSIFGDEGPKVQLWVRALRLHQWTKNLLLFVPLLASHRLGEIDLLFSGCIAFLLFGCCASGVYILNDLLDLAEDRRHPRKKFRPFASGALPINAAVVAFPLLLALAFGGASVFMAWEFTAILGIYYLVTLAYSLRLKRLVIIDVITLAMLYAIRIIAGTYAFDISLTFWMLAFSLFMFLSLALVKRYAELKDSKDKGSSEPSGGRGYYPDDLELISSLGTSSGFIAVLVLALYIQDEATVSLYRYPQLIWLACPLLLFWIS